MRHLRASLAALVLAATVAGSATWHVDPANGRDDGQGSAASPFATLMRAAAVVEPGDVVLAYPGVYYEHVKLERSGTAAAPITFRSTGGREKTIVTGANRDLREGRLKWEATAGTPGLHQVPLALEPATVLCDELNLYRYPSLGELVSGTVSDVAGQKRPGPGPKHGFAWADGLLYVRLDLGGRDGDPDPNAHVLKASPPRGGGFRGDEIDSRQRSNFSISLLADCAHVPFGKCLCGRAAASGQMQSATDVDARHEVHYEGMQAHGHHCVPMRIGERTVGVLNLYLQAGQARSARLEQFTLGVANALAGVISRIQAEDEKARLQVQLTQSQKMESIGRLAGGVAHDFNNKLMTILGNAELCQLDLEKDHPAREYVDDIVACAGQAGNLTRQLLAFARKQTIEPEVLDLNDAIDGTLRMLRRLIGENIDLTWQPGPGLWPVLVDPSQVDQILANLTVNARDAIAGTGRIGIGTANQPVDASYAGAHVDAMPGDYVTLTVADDGCGMGADVQAHLFEPFFTTKGIGKGTGLGLATVYGIVRQNGGFITVYSEPGKGSTFRVHLPRSLEEVRLNGTGDAEAAMPVAHGAETVLLVEDEERLLRSATDLLGRLGYTVLAAASAAQAVELAHRHGTGIDLLLTDVVMPEMNGRELRDRLVALLPSLRCIFMSGYTADIIAPAGVLERGVHFLQKPFTLRQLAIKVREALDASQAAN